MIQKPLNRNKKGTVLFTVIVVMMVMTIILMATFVVIVAAQKQAVNNFTDNQAYVTAKSVLDIFVNGTTNVGDNQYDDIREMMIGKYTTPATGDPYMSGGMAYPGTINSSDKNLTNLTKIVEVSLPTGTTGMGEFVNGGVKVERISRVLFKASVTVKDGGVRKADGTLSESGNSVRTVSRYIRLSPNPSSSLFDSALVSCAGNTQMLGTAPQLYGGYVNTSSGGVTLNGGVRYIGRIFAKSGLTVNDSLLTEAYLGTKKMLLDSDGDGTAEETYVLDYIESQGNISLPRLNVKNIAPAGETPIVPSGIPNPYIYGSGSGSVVTLGSSGGVACNIGEPGKPIDIYCEHNVVIKVGTTMYGNIYCKGNVTLNGGTVNGLIKCNNPSATGSTTVTGGLSQIDSSMTFPTPYNMNNYDSVQQILASEYKKGGSTFGGLTPKTIGDCFGIGGAVNSFTLDGTVTTITTSNMTSTVTKPTGETVAYAANLLAKGPTYAGGPSSVTGTYTIKLGKEDLFFTLPNTSYSDLNNNPYFQNLTIKVVPDGSSSDPSDYGNVYFYTPGTNNFRIAGSNRIYTDWSAITTDYQYGSKEYGGRTLESKCPSHIFWLIDGTRYFNYEYSTMQFHGYIYAKDTAVGDNGGTNAGYAQGLDHLRSVNSYYDNYKMPNAFNASNLKPAFIGCCIGSKSQIGGGSCSIFVDPPSDNIFDQASTQPLKDYNWSAALYGNN